VRALEAFGEHAQYIHELAWLDHFELDARGREVHREHEEIVATRF
jgi:hypothetical protein